MTFPKPASAGFFQGQPPPPDLGEDYVTQDELDAAASAAARASLIAAGVWTVPTPVRAWCGGVTENQIKLNFDVIATDVSEIETVGMLVSLTPDLWAPVFRSSDVAPTVTSGLAATYRTGAFTATGLAADTTYYVAPVVNGSPATSMVLRIRTAPTQGTAKSFSFVVGSCTNSAYQLGNPYAGAAATAPAFVVHCGDMDYSDIIIDDVRAQRDRNTRTWRSTAGVQDLMKVAPIIYMPDDHDFGPDDNHWDKELSTGVSHADIGRNTRQAVRETTPRYSDWSEEVLSQSWTWGRVRFILPDLRSQRRYEDGGPTFLGDGSDPPTGYNHYAVVMAAIDQAVTDGMKVLVFISTSTWAPAIFDSWERFAPEEQEALATKFRNCGVQVILVHGDAHQGVIDDGTNTDRSAGKDGKVPVVCTSGWNWGVPFHSIVSAKWNGANGDVTGTIGNANLFVSISITDNGGSNVHWAVKFYGAPLTPSTATLLGTYSDTDAAVTVGFKSSSSQPVPTGENLNLSIQKTWMGPVDGCSVNYSWASGPSGVATFLPNQNTTTIPRAYTTGAPDTVTISSPTRCVLGAITARPISYYTPAAETTTLVSAMSVVPSVEIRRAIDTFIVGLKSAGIWAKIDKLYWLGAHTQADSLLQWKSPGTGSLSVVGAVGFSPLAGWRGGNVIGTSTIPHLETGYAIPGGRQDSHTAFVRTLDVIQSFNGEFGAEKYYLNPYSTTAADFRTRSSSTTSDSQVLGTNGAGSFGLSRTASGSYKTFVNGVLSATITRTSSAPTANTMWLCGFYNASLPSQCQSGARRVAVAMLGQGLSDVEVGQYVTLETAFLQGVGTL